RDVEPQRAEAGVVTRAYARAELDLVEAGRGIVAHRAGVNEGHDPQRPAKQPGADARFEREFGQRAGTRRIAFTVARADPAIGIATHRAAAAGIEPTRRRDGGDRRAGNAGEAHTARQHQIFTERAIIRSIDLRAHIVALGSPGARHFRRD